ncbi:hypothetical protein F2Q70_00007315, partial [Brassica cretica]
MSNEHKKRLESRLEWEGFIETKIKSDGNCQFSSLADQLFRCPEYHEKVRERIVKQLKTCPKIYREFVEMDSSKKRANDLPKDYSEYVKNMSKSGVWGDSVTLQAAADTLNEQVFAIMQFGVKIVVITSEKEVPSMEIVPKSLTLERVVYLSHLVGVHYNSIYLKGSETDTAPMELPGKSKNKSENDKETQGRNENDKHKNNEKKKNDRSK